MYYIGVAIMEEIYLRGLLQNKAAGNAVISIKVIIIVSIVTPIDVRLSIMVNLLSR